MYWGTRATKEDVEAMVEAAKVISVESKDGEKVSMAKSVIALGKELLRRMREAKLREERRKWWKNK